MGGSQAKLLELRDFWRFLLELRKFRFFSLELRKFHKGISGLPLDVKPLLELNLGHNQSHTQTNSQNFSPAALMIALPLLTIQVKVPLSIEA